MADKKAEKDPDEAMQELVDLTEEPDLYGSPAPPLAQEQPRAPGGPCPFCGQDECGHNPGGPA